jgi:hypothetical protein
MRFAPAAMVAGRRACRFLLIAILSLSAGLARAQVNVTTYHNDTSRSGLNMQETVLTPSTVNSAQFGKLFSVPLDGNVYAQPLVLTNVAINGSVHTVLYVATEHGSIYAIDGDATSTTATVLWQVNLIPNGGTTVVGTVNIAPVCTDIVPEIAITGTPVIDPSTGTLYVVVKSMVAGNAVQYLHALNVANGADVMPPAVIGAMVPGSGYDAVNGVVTFNSLLENQRAALLLINGHVVIAWTSHCDTDPWHGWVMSYSASTLAQEAVWNATPYGGEGGIWMSGAGPAADANGNIYFATGNGTADGVMNFGDSIVKLALTQNTGNWSFSFSDYFTPYNQAALATIDADLGSGGLMLLPTLPGQNAVLIQMSKVGTMYVLNQNNLGEFCPPTTPSCQNADSQILEEIPAATGGVWGAPAYWAGTVYWAGAGDPITAYAVNPATGILPTTPMSQSSQIFSYPGPTPSISANGSTAGILWALDYASGNNSNPTTNNLCADGAGCQVLYAFDATNLGNFLYTSSEVPDRDSPGEGVKFSTPTIANGRVYVGGHNAVSVYGLLPTTLPSAQSPIASPVPGTYAGTQMVSLSDYTPNAVIYYTLDGSVPTTASAQYTAPLPITATTTVNAIAAANGYNPSSIMSATYLYETASGVSVDLAAPFNSDAIYAIASDGTPPPANQGLDAAGDAYSAAQLGTSITWNGVAYALGSPNAPSGASFTTIRLPGPAGAAIASVNVLAAMVNNDSSTPQFTLSFTDGSQKSYAQKMSNWTNPHNYAGETIVKTMPYYINSSGAQVQTPAYLYGYSFAVPPGETPRSITLPYDPNVVVLALDLIPVLSSGTTGTTLPGQVATPSFSPAPGTYAAAQTVTLATAASGATIYYTVDGSAPTTSSPKYTVPITVGVNTVINAIAVASGMENSAVASGEFIIQPATPTFSPPAGAYSTPQNVTINSSAGANITYTTNDNLSSPYLGALAVCGTETLAAVAGTGGSQSSTATAVYTIVPLSSIPPISVNLSSVDNVYALGTPGAATPSSGIDNSGSSYATSVLERSEAGCVGLFSLGTPGAPSAMSSTLIPLSPQGNYATLSLLATAVNGAQDAQVFTISYTDGSSEQITQSLSSWNAPNSFPGEGIAMWTPYKLTSNGAVSGGNYNLYYYSFALNAAKTVNSLSLPNNRNVVVLAVDLTPLAPNTPAPVPTFNESSGTYNGIQTIVLADAAPGATIYYTTDGTTPTTNSSQYTNPISVGVTTTINAMAVGGGYAPSPVASAVITIVLGPAPAPVMVAASETFCGSMLITLTDSNAGAAIYYTLDGSTPTAASILYTRPFAIAATTTVNAIALANGYTASPVATATYVASSALSVSPPVFSPAPGAYATAQSITLSDVTPGATIDYAALSPIVSGLVPYTNPIPVGSTTTLSAVATEAGCTNSPTVSATYTITSTGPAPISVSLAASEKVYAIGAPGTAVTGGGIDGGGDAYAGNLLGTSLTYNGLTYTLSAAGADSAATNTKMTLPAGSYTSLNLLGAGVNGNHLNQVFKVTYTDGTTTSFTQSVSNWASAPQGYAGESLALTMPSYVLKTGAVQTATRNIYAYSFALNSAKTVQSLTLPATTNVVVLAVNLSAAAIVPVPTATAPAFAPVAGTFTAAQPVTLTDSTPGAAIYYTLNGSTPTTASTLYTGPFTVCATTTVNAIAAASGYLNSAVSTATYTINIPVPTAATPAFTPVAGTYTAAQPVTLTDSTPGAAIYYTVNGSTPTTASTLYTGPFTVSATTTVNAIAAASGYLNSAVSTATYTIASSGPAPISVSLAASEKVYAIGAPGAAVTGGGIDGGGDAYAGNLLGTSLTYNGVNYTLSAAGADSAATNTKITLPAGSYTSLNLLGAGVNGNHLNQVFKVTYTDGTTTSFTQSVSNWASAPQGYAGESLALTMPSYVLKTGAVQTATRNIYAYSFALNTAKTVQSLTLPVTTNVVVLSVDLSTH